MLKAKFQNTLAWGKKPVTIDLTQAGLISVKGKHLSSSSKSSNGVGKSTILNSLAWVIYGEYPKGFRKTDIINENAKKNCLSECWIERNGKQGYIVRGISCDVNTYSHNGKEIEIDGDFLLFFVEGEDLRGNSTKVTQAVIDKFMGIDYESFMIAALFSNANESFAAKTSGKQEELFSKLLHLEELELARQRVKDRQKEVKASILGCDIEIDKFESHIEREKNRLERLSESVEEWKSSQAQKIQRVKTTIEATKDAKLEAEDLHEELIEQLTTEDEKLKDIETELNKFDEAQIKADKAQWQSRLSEIDSDIGGIKREIRNLQSEVSQAQSMRGKVTCPKCFHEVTEEHLYEVIEEKNEKIDSLTEDQSKLTNSRLKVYESYEKAEKQLSSLNSKRNEKVAQEATISRLKGRISDAEKDANRFAEKVKELEATVASLEIEVPPQQNDSSNIEKELERLEDCIEEQEDLKDEYNSQLEDLDFWAIGFGPTGIRNLLIRSVIPELNKQANRFIDILSNGEIEIEFTGETEVGSGSRTQTRNKLEVKVVDRFGSGKYDKESSGEKRRIDLAIALALNNMIASRVGLSFLIVDEVFASLDNAGKTSVLDLLEEIRKDIPCVLVISNQDDILADNFDESWTVTRKGKESWIERESTTSG